MNRTSLTRGFRIALVAAATILVIAIAPSATAAPPEAVDVTITETLDSGVPNGVYKTGSIPNCTTPTVTTPVASVVETPTTFRFAGEKVFHCDEAGNTFTIEFSARAKKCETTDSGSWRLIAGTGDFAGATGSGRLIGTYFGGAGTACDNDGIDDRWIGKIKFAS